MATSIIAEQDLSRDIYEANSGYRQYYGQMNFAKQAKGLASAAGYNEAIANAYMTSKRQQNLLAQSDYGAQGQRALGSQLSAALSNAYDTYRSQHAQGVAEMGQKVDATIGEVAGDLRKTGQELGSKYAQYQEGAFRWLEDLNQQGFLNKGGQFDSYEEYTQWHTDQAQLDADGNPIEPMSEGEWRAAWANQQVFKDVFDAEGNLNEDKLKTAIFSQLDEEGNIMKDEAGNPIITADLNTKGIEMLDKLNSMSSEEYGSYSAWLAKNNKELYQWSVQRAMLGDGTNAAAAMANMGSDGMYSFMERFGGLSQGETEKLFGDFELITERLSGASSEAEKVSKANKEALGKSTKVITDLYQSLDIDNAIFTLELGNGEKLDLSMTDMITAQFATATGVSMEEAAKLLETGNFSTIKIDSKKATTLGALAGGSILVGIGGVAAALGVPLAAGAVSFAISTAAAASGTALSTATLSAAVPVVGWVVAGAALIAAVVLGAFSLSESHKANLEATTAANKQEGAIRTNFDQWAVQSASVAYEMRRQALAK